MKKFLLHILSFLAGLAVINTIFLVIVYKSYLKEYEHISYAYSTYILADSRGLPLEKCALENNMGNFSDHSESYYDIERKLKFLIRHTDLNKIILSADGHMISNYRENMNNLDRSAHFTTVEDFEDPLEFITQKYTKRYLPLLNAKSRSIVKRYFFSKTIHRFQGKPPTDWSTVPKNEQQKIARDRVKMQYPDKNISEDLVSALNRIFDICEKHNIQIIGIKFPLSHAYQAALEQNSISVDSLFIQRDLPILDYQTETDLDDSFFENQDHLNEYGGEKLCSLIINDLQKIGGRNE